jgi:putative membrane protein
MNWKLVTIAAFSLGTLVVGAGTSWAEEPYNDNDFFQKATVSTMCEQELGRLAQSNGAAQGVKDFGKRLVDDHKKMHENLKIMAKNVDLQLPNALPDKEKAIVEKFKNLKGADFDREFAKQMVDSHQKSVALHEQASAKSGNAQLKNYAKEMLPTLNEHLTIAKKLHTEQRGE